MPENQEQDAVAGLAEADGQTLRDVGALGKGVAERDEVIDDETLHPLLRIGDVVTVPGHVIEGGGDQRHVEPVGNIQQAQLLQSVAPSGRQIGKEGLDREHVKQSVRLSGGRVGGFENPNGQRLWALEDGSYEIALDPIGIDGGGADGH